MEEKIVSYTPDDFEYPDKLRNFKDRPKRLYVKGKLPDPNRKSVAIIGKNCELYTG